MDVAWRAAGRGVLLLAACAAVEALAWRLVTTAVPPALAALRVDAPLGARGVGAQAAALAAILLLLAWSWLCCATVLVVGDLLRQGARAPGRSRLMVPPGWRRSVAALLGVGALCVPGVVAADGSGRGRYGGEPAAARIAGLPLPDRPLGVGAVPCAGTTHRVAAGQSLWTIAHTHLGPDATADQIAAEWPRWYAANVAVIGEDPDLITPGAVLRAPTAHLSRSQHQHLTAGTGPTATDGGPR